MFWIRGLAEEVDVTIGPEATNDGGSGWGLNGAALGTDGHFAIVAHAHPGLLTKDIGPPRAFRKGTEHGAFFLAGLVPGGFRRRADFAMDLMGVGVCEQLLQQSIGLFEVDNFFSGKESRQPILEVMVAAFDFTFGLRGWGKAQGHAVEVEGRTELREGLRGVGKKEGVIVNVESQGQTVRAESAVQKIQMSQEGFRIIEASADIEAGGVIQEVEQGVLVSLGRQPVVRGSIVLPESAQVLSLPTFEGLRCFLEAGVWGKVMLERPATHTGPVGFKLQAPKQFTGGTAVGARRFGGEELFEQLGDFGGPVAMMIPTRSLGRPDRG